MTAQQRHRVAVFVRPGAIPFETGIPSRVFGMARDADGRKLYEVITCTVRPGRLHTTSDFDLHIDNGPAVLSTADTVVIPASDELDLKLTAEPPADIAAALAMIRPGTRIASICTAAFLLAAAGMLNGRPAATHWAHAEELQARYPKVDVDADVLFVDDGDVLTSAGVAAGVDLCLHMVRADFGSRVANAVARASVVPPWREGGQAQFIELPVPHSGTAATSRTRSWALRNLDRPLSLEELAEHANMSVRTFSRRFRAEAGMTPGQWLIRQRVTAARHMLESSELSADRVALRCGFGTAASLRRHFHAVLGISPSNYRKTFRLKESRRRQ